MKFRNHGRWSLTMILLLLTVGILCVPASGGLAEGRYAVDVRLSGGSGKISVESPALMVAEEGSCFAWIIWNSSQFDQIRVGEIICDNQSGEGEHSSFWIPVTAFDQEIEIIASTHILGEPHEISYSLRFYADSIGPENPLPQEAVERVLLMAMLIILVGGILNHFSKKKRKQDYLGKKG